MAANKDHTRIYKAVGARRTVNLTLQLASNIRTLKILTLSPAAAPATATRKRLRVLAAPCETASYEKATKHRPISGGRA
jgi:hypothetical protein